MMSKANHKPASTEEITIVPQAITQPPPQVATRVEPRSSKASVQADTQTSAWDAITQVTPPASTQVAPQAVTRIISPPTPRQTRFDYVILIDDESLAFL